MQLPVSLTILIIATNVIFSFLGFSSKKMMNETILWPYQVKRKYQYYRFLTSGFLHADFVHLFFNMFTLYFFGSNLEYLLTYLGLGGTVAYAGIYLLAIFISDIPTYQKYKDSYGYRSLGASGAVSAVVFASILFSPWQSIYLYGAIKISAAVYAVLFLLYCVYMGKRGKDNINHDAHFWGAIFGLAATIALIYVKQPDLFKTILLELKHPSLLGKE